MFKWLKSWFRPVPVFDFEGVFAEDERLVNEAALMRFINQTEMG